MHEPGPSPWSDPFFRRVMIGMAVVAMILLLGGCPAKAQSQCAPWTAMKQRLEEKFAEVPIGGGQNSETLATIVLVSPSGATFTIVMVDRLGIACMVAVGKGWDPGVLPMSDKET